MFAKGGGFVLFGSCLIHSSTGTANCTGSNSMRDGSFCECRVWGGRAYFIALHGFFLCNRIKLTQLCLVCFCFQDGSLKGKTDWNEWSHLRLALVPVLGLLTCYASAWPVLPQRYGRPCCVLRCFAFEGLSSLYGKEGHLHFRAHCLVWCLNVNSLVRMMCGWIYFALMPLGVTSRVRTGQDKLHEGKILLLYLVLVHSVTLHITKGKK